MLKNRFFKIFKSITKLILPLLFKILIKLKVNRRAINYLQNKSFQSNNIQDFSKLIQKFLISEKILALDIGAQGGFNSDNFFPKKYNIFFDSILVEPIKSEAKKLIESKYVIEKGLWSKKEKKKLYILGNRLGSSSLYEPDPKFFDLHNLEKNEYNNFKVTEEVEIDCDTLSNCLEELKIKNLDYLKIDTQGSELEILKGIGEFRPIMIKVETHIFSMYKDAPSWEKILSILYDLNYVVIDWRNIGKHVTRVPAELEIILIPNFMNAKGEKLIVENISKFKSLLLILGQINVLKTLLKKFKLEDEEVKNLKDFYFN